MLTDQHRQAIREAIERQERRTSGEIVTVVASAADSYAAHALFVASAVAFTLPAALWLLLGWWGPQWLIAAQLSVFITALLLISRTRLRFWVVPKAIRRQRAARLAREAFFLQGVHQTRERTGVLIFVCVAERFVEVIADSGVYQRVSESVWDDVVTDLSKALGNGEVGSGFVRAIEQVGEVLAAEFPRDASFEDPLNELNDHLVEL